MLQALKRWLTTLSGETARALVENERHLALQSRLDNIESRTQSLVATVASSVETQHEFVKTAMSEVQASIHNVQQMMAQDAARHPLSQLSATVDRLEANIANLAASLTTIDAGQSTRQGAMANEVNAVLNTVIPIQHTAAAIETQLSRLDPAQQQSSLDALTIQTTNLASSLANMENALSSRQGELANEVNATLNAVKPLAQSAKDVESKLATLDQSQLRTQIETLLARTTALSTNLSTMETGLSRQHGALANEVNAILNIVLPLQHRTAALEARLNTLDQTMTEARALDQTHSMLLARSMLALSNRMNVPATGQRLVVAAPANIATLNAQMAAFKSAAPNNFESWYKAYIAGVKEGQRTPEGNLSHEGHIGAGYFRMFLNIHARGRVLDIGCGPLSMPSYLVDCPLDQLAGIDPQDPHTPHPFQFAKTFAETLPWADASFDTVVVGTSLDHVYLLDKALAAIKRVLTPDGRLLLWTALLESTPPYDPYGATFQPPDEYHLFHPGRNWFYDLFKKDYYLIERVPTVSSAEFLAFQRISGA